MIFETRVGFSEVYNLKTRHNVEFARNLLNDLDLIHSEGWDLNEYSSVEHLMSSVEYDNSSDQESLVRIYQQYRTSEEIKFLCDEEHLTFNWFTKGSDTSEGSNELKIFSDEDQSGDIEQVVNFLKSLWTELNIEGFTRFRYSKHCDKPYVGEFGGGVVLIGKNFCEYFDIDDWSDKRIQELNHK